VFTGGLPNGFTSVPSLPTTLSTGQSATVTFTPPLGGPSTYIIEFQVIETTFGRSRTNYIVLQQGTADLIYFSGVLRDFTSATPDFSRADGDNAVPLVQSMLGADRKPVFAGPATTIQSAASFKNWWTDSANQQVSSIVLTNAGAADPSIYSFNSSAIAAGHTF